MPHNPSAPFSPAAATSPVLTEGLLSNARALIEKGREQEALTVLEQAIAANPTPDAHFLRGTLLAKDKDKSQEALHAFEDAVLLDDKHHKAYASMARLFGMNFQIFEAIECYGIATDLCPENTRYKHELMEIIKRVHVKKHNPALQEKILSFMQDNEIDCTDMGAIWQNLLKLSPEFKPLYKATHQNTYPYFKKILLKAKDHSPLVSAYFTEGLKNTLVYNIEMETFLTGLRHVLLDCVKENAFNLGKADLVKIAASLSAYCYQTEFIFEESDDEKDQVEELKNRIESATSGSIDLYGLCVLSCYRPLYTLQNTDELKKALAANDDTALIALTHIDDHQKLEANKKNIARLTSIDDDTSRKVQEQYEDFPYPRWGNYALGAFSREMYDHTIEGYLKGKKADILVAGCGTGREAIELAAVFSDSHVTAVDLSLTSLSYAQMKAEKHKVENITFAHGDILRLGETGKKFDYIASSGVLHHMKDPEAGWAVLNDLLKPGCAMRIALYSEQARRGIVKAHEIIKDKGFKDNADGIRAFRREIPALMNKHDLRLIMRYRDFFTMSECRDLLFHVQEHRFNLMQIKGILTKFKLDFAGFHLSPASIALYKKEFADDPEAINLETWHKFEERHPDTFADMYLFWCRKQK